MYLPGNQQAEKLDYSLKEVFNSLETCLLNHTRIESQAIALPTIDKAPYPIIRPILGRYRCRRVSDFIVSKV